MNSFDIQRFGKTLRWVVSVNFRTLIMWTVGSILAVFMGEMVLLKMNHYHTPDVMILNFSQFGGALFLLVTLILVSSVVSGINNKRRREAFLMLPATNLEKFLSLAFYSTVICTLCVFLAMAIGDSLRMAWFGVSGPYNNYASVTSHFTNLNGTFYWWSSTVPQILKNLMVAFSFVDDSIYRYTLGYRLMQIVVIVGLGLWIHSLYTLGGTLLRKYAFVATSVVMILCMLLFAKFMMYFEFSMFRSVWKDNHYVSQEVGTMAYVLGIILPLLSVFNYWASFHIFKGFQLITNKWTNYDFHK